MRAPVLVMNTRSPFYTPEYEAYVRRLSPKPDYRTLEGVGHFFMLGQPTVFNKALMEMLREFDLLAK